MKLNDYQLINWLGEDIHKTLHIHKLVHMMPTDGYSIYNGVEEININHNHNLIFVL